MRKLFPLLIALLMLLLSVPGCVCGEVSTFESIMAAVEIPAGYTVLTQNNLQELSVWLESKGTSTEQTTNDFLSRGVLLQARSDDGSRVFELRAIKTEESASMWNINDQTEAIRKVYRMKHKNNDLEHYTFSDATWKKTAKNGRFLILPYTYRDNGDILYRGFMRRTIYNGYEVDLDMQVYGRSATKQDNNALNAIWDSFKFVQEMDMPPVASAKINFTEKAPQETNSPSFKITGTAAEGVHFTTVVMGLSTSNPVVTSTVVEKNGKFSIPVKLPKEGSFVVTITAEYKDEEVAEYIFPVRYERTMLAVNVTAEPGSVVKEDEVRIAGTAEPGALIQVIVDDSVRFTKHVTAAGKFAIYVDVKEEGEHTVVLRFSKKALEDKTKTFTFTRKLSTSEQLNELKKQASKPAYPTLVKKIDSYLGKVMGYTGYITDISLNGDDYVVQMALSKKGGKYSNFLYVNASEQPDYTVGEKVAMYGVCEGMSLPDSDDDGSTSGNTYPLFSLLLFSAID